ncbi:hypothetical protein NC998_03615 [Trichocoleus desertorum GB2-A4]|uniref:Uncharacterized protein n=1 Tax=Trichocoleus desertorum GB2-A4 TaxID=2933944 RepID=A0ABV0J339_9CYAN
MPTEHPLQAAPEKSYCKSGLDTIAAIALTCILNRIWDGIKAQSWASVGA